MKLIVICSILLSTCTAFAQGVVGDWHGKLALNGHELRIVLHITQNEGVYSTTLDSPDQGAKGIPATATSFDGESLVVKFDALSAVYHAQLKGKELVGVFEQGSNQLPLTMTHEVMEKSTVRRPQEPKKKAKYKEIDVSFKNPTAGISLSGTLTVPKGKGPFPVAILVSGSGPQNRNEELLGHKPFLVIADHLTKKGVAVLRYDDRGVAASEGDFNAATSKDFAEDVRAAIEFLKTQSYFTPEQIGIIGHSEGGLIAPAVAAENEDVDFIVTLAGPGVPGIDILLAQQELIARAEGVDEKEIEDNRYVSKAVFDYISKHPNGDQLQANLAVLIDSLLTERNVSIPAGVDREEFIQQEVQSLTTPWMAYFLRFDPRTALVKVTCPVLAVNGSLDLQVPSKMNLDAIEKAVESNGNMAVTVKEFEGLNHLFQHCETGAPSEYAVIEETFSKEVLKYMHKWILARGEK